MAAYPDLQKQAQDEIDQVFGQDEMPHTADGKKLPFLKACFLEVTINHRLGFQYRLLMLSNRPCDGGHLFQSPSHTPTPPKTSTKEA